MSAKDTAFLEPAKVGKAWQKSLKEPASQPSSFGKLPDEIIYCILKACDPNSFASLVLLNRDWRRISQQPLLYTHQLSRIRSYSARHYNISSPLEDVQLPFLRRDFAREVKRNLFDAYRRPRETIVNLVSTSISSSSAFPGGEAFHFSFSAKGHYVLAYSTSRIYIIDIRIPHCEVKRELKILRRPASASILDDGTLLAVLSTDHQVDIYKLAEVPPKHIQAVALDHPPRTIALSPTGSVLAAAYDGGVEVYSLLGSALQTDRRSVKCDAADSLSFSKDGTQLLGTTLGANNPGTVVLTAPYFNSGDHSPGDDISQLWTTSIIFPNSTRDCSHAVLLPNLAEDGTNWIFTYDRVFETFRAVRLDDLRNGKTYFTGPIAEADSIVRLLPSTLPAATESGHLVAAAFQGREVWLYGVPEDLDTCLDTKQTSTNILDTEHSRQNASISRSSSGRSHTWPCDGNSPRIPQWQILCDKSRNTFVQGFRVASFDGVNSVKWVDISRNLGVRERLVVAAPGGLGTPREQLFDGDSEIMTSVDGGRLLLLDFDYSSSNGTRNVITIDVGEKEPEVLEEERRDLDTEIAIVRRRTVAQRRSNRTDVSRTATVMTHNSTNKNRIARIGDIPSRVLVPPTVAVTSVLSPEPEGQIETALLDDEQEALDAPYAHGSPRSGTTLRRAATAAAINRRLHPPRVDTREHLQYRRADGREDHPHESDADHWVPPPPPYTKDPLPELPQHLRNAIPAALSASPISLQKSSTQRSNNSVESDILSSLNRSRTTYVPSSRSVFDASLRVPNRSPNVSMNSADSLTNNNLEEELETEDLYAVSPPQTPEPTQNVPHSFTSAHRIPRRPVASTSIASESPPVIMSSTALQSFSPIPQHVPANSTGQVAATIPERWEDSINSAQRATHRPLSNGSISVHRNRLDAETFARPNHDHHLTDLPPTTPNEILQVQGETKVDHDDRSLISAILSSAISTVEEGSGSSSGLELPSEAQILRLNSRSGKPPNYLLSDPSRRSSGGWVQPRQSPQHTSHVASPNNCNAIQSQLSTSSTVNHTYVPPRASMSAYIQPADLSHVPDLDPPPENVSFSTPNQDHGRQISAGAYRPRMTRFETIHSVASQYDSQATTSTNVPTVACQPSRAKRTDTINAQEARRTGWGGTTRKKKTRIDIDGAGSAKWTSPSRDSYGPRGGQKELTGTRCLIM